MDSFNRIFYSSLFARGRVARRWQQRLTRVPEAKKRQGSLILEACISALLLVTATVALMKLAKANETLSRSANDQFAITLAAQNALDRLHLLPFESLQSEIESVSRSVSESAPCEITITSEAFESLGTEGLHLRVIASAAKGNVSVTLHDWRFDPRESEQ